MRYSEFEENIFNRTYQAALNVLFSGDNFATPDQIEIAVKVADRAVLEYRSLHTMT